VEDLEPRVPFHLQVVQPLADAHVAPGRPQSRVDLTRHFDNDELVGTLVRLRTSLGGLGGSEITSKLDFCHSGAV
jgi:hypothetical protein